MGDYALYVPMEQGTGTDVSDLGPENHLGVNQGNVSWTTDPNRGTVLDFADRGDNGNTIQSGLEFTGYKGILGGEPRTISLWIKTTWASQNLALWGPMATTSETFMVNMEGGYIRVQNWAGNRKTTSVLLNDNVWHHVVVVVPDLPVTPTIHDVQVYIDGVEETSYSNGGGGGEITTTAGLDLRIGDDGGDNAFRDYTGLMDDFRLYDAALTAEEVESVHMEYVKLKWPPMWEYVEVDDDLEWGTTAWMSATSYDVYFGTNQTAVETKAVTPETVTSPAYDPGTMPMETEHFWRVDAHGTDPNSGNPATYEGPLWHFTTVAPEPYITADPVDAFVGIGETANFEVTAQFTETYAWYIEAGDTDVLVTDGTTAHGSVISGATTDTLTITNVQPEDQEYYYCKCSRTGRPDAFSSPAFLLVKQLVGHWDMDAPGVGDPNNVMPDLSAFGNNLTIYNDVAWTTGRDGTANGAAWFDGVDDMILSNNDAMPGIPVGDRSFTTSAYVYLEGDNFYLNPHGIVGWGEGFVGTVSADTSHKVHAFRLMPNGTDVQEMWWDADNTYTLQTARDGFDAFTGRWVHVASTYDHMTKLRRIYVNGSFVDEKEEPDDLLVETTQYFGIGWQKNDNAFNDKSFPFYGAIDDVKIWNYALTTQEMATEYYTFTGDAVCWEAVPYDTNGDCIFNLADLAVYMQSWLDCNIVPDCIN